MPEGDFDDCNRQISIIPIRNRFIFAFGGSKKTIGGSLKFANPEQIRRLDTYQGKHAKWEVELFRGQ